MMDKLKTLLERMDEDEEPVQETLRDLIQILIDGLEESQKIGEEIMEKYKP